MLNPKIVLVVIAAVTLKVCQCDVAVANERIQHRFLGTLNRYYVSSRDLLANGTDYIDLANSDAAVSQLQILDATKNVAIVIHGRDSNAFSDFGIKLRESFINSDGNLVVILVDWPFISSMDYATIVNSVPYIADDIITLIGRLDNAGKINRRLVHILGFDVGAHVAGLVSRDANTRVQRITGLSPAGDSWVGNPRSLRSTDADYVEVIHTDYGGLGIGSNLGSVDFFANSGDNQPGCTDNQCGHDRAWQLFAAALDMGGHLMGLKCDDYDAVINNGCRSGPALALGTNDLSKEGSGIYRVSTGAEYPYNA
ncbi:lipase member H-B-like [Leguminivora glycinivorella]|uniref:lipase member H-B-like n=1 Tax=Leguminivora glycinivorella TaxID=1035111 RepID=UPI0020104408|nr:lipase member H-B-like [Leguminivora glycinivorella]